jgi:hypothetical protein
MGNRLMEAQTADPNFASPMWNVSAGGQRFVVLTVGHTKSASITLLTNWPAQLGK